MFWPQGGPSSNIFTGRSIFSSPRQALGQSDTECVGDVCILVASRINAENSKVLFGQIKFAWGRHPECVEQAGGFDLFDAIGKKAEKVVLGTAQDTPLTKAEADWVTKFQACIAPLMLQAQPSGEPVPAGPLGNIPIVPIAVGIGALGIIGLVVSLARR